MNRKDYLKRLFFGANCSLCDEKFDENSIEIMRAQDGLCVFRIKCKNCLKSFGVAILGLNFDEIESLFEKKEEPAPITYDDVLDAHKFFQGLDENWAKLIPKKV